MEKVKEILTIIYGIAGMIVFFAVLFYGGNTIISIISLYYKYVFFIAIPLILLYVIISKIKTKR